MDDDDDADDDDDDNDIPKSTVSIIKKESKNVYSAKNLVRDVTFPCIFYLGIRISVA